MHGPEERLRTFGDPVLKQHARDVDPRDDLTGLIDRMFDVMERAEGVGLAAPQIGVQKKVIVWRDPETDERHVLLNPRIVRMSGGAIPGEEGCLSIPGHSMEVSRAETVVVEGTDLRGRGVTIEAQGFLARIMQHEIDHLEGRLILDRCAPEERKRVLREIRNSPDS